MEPDEQNLALSQGLLGLGAGLLSGSFGHYGAFGPALGQGVSGFQQGYGGAMQRSLQLKQLKMQQDLSTAQIGNYNSETEKRKADLATQQAALTAAKQADAFANQKLGGAPQPAASGVMGVPQGPIATAADAQSGSVTTMTPTGPKELMPPQKVGEKPQSNLLNPDWHLARAEYLYSAGDRKGAEEAAKRAQELRTEERTLGKDEQDKPLEGVPGVTFNAKDGTYKKDKMPISADEVQKMKLALARAGATNVNQVVNAEKEYGKAFSSGIAKDDISYRDSATKAPDLAARANSIKKVLASGKVYTGTGADYKLVLGKALGLIGASDAETVTNTETLATNLAQNTLDSIKASGLGAGNGFSNADRDFLEKAVGGKISLEATTINRLANLAHKAASQSAKRWNDRVKMIPNSALEGTGLTRDPVEVPPIFDNPNTAPMIPKGWSVQEVK